MSDLATTEQKQRYIRALLRERAGYVQYGREDQVAQVDAELARVGHQATKPSERAERMTAKPAEVTVKRGPGRPRKDRSGGQ